MASKDNRSNRKIDEFFSPTAPGASHVGNNSNAESTAVSNEVEMRGVAEVTERTNVPLDSTQSQSLLELDLPSYPDIENLTDDDLKKDEPERASPNQVGTFSSTEGVSDWGNIGRLVKLHTSQSSPHHDSVIKGDDYLSIASGKQKDICSHLSSQVTATIERNRHMLKAILDVIVLCGQQNIAIRGHVERTSNFHSLLQFRAKTDPVLALHLQNDDNRAKYTSPRIQNELIELCADYIRKSLVKDCNRAQFNAFLADEATDASTMEQISICVRFVHRKDEDNTVEVREEFLGFVEAESTKGVALAEKFMTTQAEFGIETRKMRAQGYDGAANMAGVHRGVQAIIKQHVPEAVYVHCKAHSLNLAIGHACKEPLVRNMLSTLQTIAFAFDYSAKRLLAFQESLPQDVLVREEMERRAKLRTLCETRWANRADSLYTFRTAYPVVVQSLETLSDDGDGKARGYLCSIKQVDFIIALCATEHVLSNTVSLSKMLQGKNVDLIEAAKEASVVINVMKVERDDPSVWKEPSIPLTSGRQQHRVNIPAETPDMYWQRAVYFPLVDHLVQELTDRLLSQEDRFLGQYLFPAKLNAFNSGVQGKLYETYKTDLSEKKDFDNEILRWQTKWSHSTEEKPVALTETLQHANPDLYPNVVTIITILLTMPVSTATRERSFSTMRRVKTNITDDFSRGEVPEGLSNESGDEIGPHQKVRIRAARVKRVTDAPQNGGLKVVLRIGNDLQRVIGRRFNKGVMFQEVYDWAGSREDAPLHFTIQNGDKVISHDTPIADHCSCTLIERVSLQWDPI
ncbi:52 kDa repressor of the inhibitor of the protein kinase-like [Montipora capricornis]|uniref:52 kDa repressor of the inhibitor of the protein kinase-like n=1 Tax=Montipora capricornis TaxID=246305 RepID=UPI0035F13F67